MGNRSLADVRGEGNLFNFIDVNIMSLQQFFMVTTNLCVIFTLLK